MTFTHLLRPVIGYYYGLSLWGAFVRGALDPYPINKLNFCYAPKANGLSKKEFLDAVAGEVVVCPKCRLSKTRKNAVPGEGNPDAKIMFIGEGPGYWEDIKGKPFVGAAGKFLDELLAEIALSRADVFITNIAKCRPPRNREPKPDEIQACTPYLDRQTRIIKPKFIVTLGNHSTSYIFSKAFLEFRGITAARGKFYDASILGIGVTVFPTFHPAAALYSAKYREALQRDFQLLKTKLHGSPIKR